MTAALKDIIGFHLLSMSEAGSFDYTKNKLIYEKHFPYYDCSIGACRV